MKCVVTIDNCFKSFLPKTDGIYSFYNLLKLATDLQLSLKGRDRNYTFLYMYVDKRPFLNFRYFCRLGPWQELERGKLLPDQFASLFGSILRSLNNERVDESNIDHLLPNLHATIVAPYPEMISTIESIRAEGMKTALLTNNWLVEEGKSFLPVEKRHFDVV